MKRIWKLVRFSSLNENLSKIIHQSSNKIVQIKNVLCALPILEKIVLI